MLQYVINGWLVDWIPAAYIMGLASDAGEFLSTAVYSETIESRNSSRQNDSELPSTIEVYQSTLSYQVSVMPGLKKSEMFTHCYAAYDGTVVHNGTYDWWVWYDRSWEL